MTISKMTLEEIKANHPDAFIETFDTGSQYDSQVGENVDTLDVIVWPNEEASVNDDGQNAIARYLIRA